MNEEKIKEVFSDEAFVKDLFASKSYEEAQVKLKGKDIDMSIDDIKIAHKAVKQRLEPEEGELSEDDLEGVSGGSTPFCIGTLVSLFTAGIVYTGVRKLS